EPWCVPVTLESVLMTSAKRVPKTRRPFAELVALRDKGPCSIGIVESKERRGVRVPGMRGRGWVRRRAERAQVRVFYRPLTRDRPSASHGGGRNSNGPSKGRVGT